VRQQVLASAQSSTPNVTRWVRTEKQRKSRAKIINRRDFLRYREHMAVAEARSLGINIKG
jgi:hypothetical protein